MARETGERRGRAMAADRAGLTRRGLMGAAAGTAAFALAGPSLGAARRLSPSDKVNIAVIGAGGKGADNMLRLLSQNIVATVDVDYDHVRKALVDKAGQVPAYKQPLKEAYDRAARF